MWTHCNFFPYSESSQQGPGLFRAAKTQRRETDYRRDLGIVLETPGLLFCFVLERLVWVISHPSIEWASSKSVSLTHTCAREPVREERLWALNIAFVPELMSVFLFCKKLYLLRLWLCSDKAALHFSEGSRGLNEAHPVLSPLGGAVPLKTAMPDSRTPPYLCTEAGVCLCRAPAITVVYMTFSICCSLEWKPAEINYNTPEVFTCKWGGILELRSSMTREAS